MRSLILLRHAKSDVGDGTIADVDRPLNKRGHKDAKKVGYWMEQRHITPEWVVCSPALRTRETLEEITQRLSIPESLIQHNDRLYLASQEQLITLLADCPEDLDEILLIGHNPGLEQLLRYLCGDELPSSASGELMPTATLVMINLPDSWQQLKPGSGKVMSSLYANEFKIDE